MRYLIFTLLALSVGVAQPAGKFDFRVLATTKTSTLEKEMNAAAEEGFIFMHVMGGETAALGKEAVVVMQKSPSPGAKRTYKLLATKKTSTMAKELQALGDEGFVYKGQTIFETTFSGAEVCVIMERDSSQPSRRIEYRLLATNKTSTMQKELRDAGDAGFAIVGLTVAKTTFGGAELVSIMAK